MHEIEGEGGSGRGEGGRAGARTGGVKMEMGK
jgi:hypothetical protein